MKRALTFAVLLALGFTVAAATAVPFTWTGGSNSIWTQSGNWDPRGFPDDSSDVANIDVATNNPVKFSSGTYSVDSVSVNADTNNATV